MSAILVAEGGANSGDNGRLLRFFLSSKRIRKLADIPAGTRALATHPSLPFAVLAGARGVCLVDLISGRVTASDAASRWDLEDVAVDAAGKSLLAADCRGGRLVRIDVSDLRVEDFAVGLRSPRAVAVSATGDQVFVAVCPHGMGGSVCRIDPDGNVSVLASALANPSAVALSVDERTVYVTEVGVGALTAIDRSNGSVRRIVLGVRGARGLAVTATRAYVLEGWLPRQGAFHSMSSNRLSGGRFTGRLTEVLLTGGSALSLVDDLHHPQALALDWSTQAPEENAA